MFRTACCVWYACCTGVTVLLTVWHAAVTDVGTATSSGALPPCQPSFCPLLDALHTPACSTLVTPCAAVSPPGSLVAQTSLEPPWNVRALSTSHTDKQYKPRRR
jgi:hypothetical protein